jgi:hypothetical protein
MYRIIVNIVYDTVAHVRSKPLKYYSYSVQIQITHVTVPSRQSPIIACSLTPIKASSAPPDYHSTTRPVSG